MNIDAQEPDHFRSPSYAPVIIGKVWLPMEV